MKWLDVLLELILGTILLPYLEEVFPDGIPAEVLQAVKPEIQRLLGGEEVNLFDLRRLILSVTDDKLREIGAL